MPWVWLVSSWMHLILSTMLLFFGFFDMSKAHFIMVCITHLDLLSSFMLIQMLTGQVIRLIDALSQVSISCQVFLLSRGAARSRKWFLVPILRLSIVPLPTPLASLFGFAGFWLTWMLHSPLPLLFIVTIIVLSTLLIMMSSMNAPSILRSIATSLASISREEILSYSPSPLLTSLLISLPRLTRLVVFEILYPNSSWLPPYHLEFEGRCQCIAQTSLAHWAQPRILYLWFTHFTCTAHIPNLYKAFYCTLLYTHQYTDYSVFLSHFIFLTYYKLRSKSKSIKAHRVSIQILEEKHGTSTIKYVFLCGKLLSQLVSLHNLPPNMLIVHFSLESQKRPAIHNQISELNRVILITP